MSEQTRGSASRPLAVFLLPPQTEDTELFKRAKKLFRGLHADVVESDVQMGKWAGPLARRIPDQGALRRTQAKMA
jgi:hypothetical protein